MTGAHCHVCCKFNALGQQYTDLTSENMASHRAQLLLQLLPMALAYGASEIEPQVEPLKVRILSTHRRNVLLWSY